MNGRRIFSRFSCVINLLAKLTPRVVLAVGKIFTDGSEGRVALLIRYCWVKKASRVVGSNLFVGRTVVLKNLHCFEVGKNVSIHALCYIDAAGGVVIGNDVSIAHGSSVISFEHGWHDCSVPIKYNPTIPKKVVIGDDVWIGCGVRILAGSRIGSRVIVAAGSVVKGNLKSGHLYGGVPAKVIGEIDA